MQIFNSKRKHDCNLNKTMLHFILTLDIKSALHIHSKNVHPEVCSRSDKIHGRRVILKRGWYKKHFKIGLFIGKSLQHTVPKTLKNNFKKIKKKKFCTQFHFQVNILPPSDGILRAVVLLILKQFLNMYFSCKLVYIYIIYILIKCLVHYKNV